MTPAPKTITCMKGPSLLTPSRLHHVSIPAIKSQCRRQTAQPTLCSDSQIQTGPRRTEGGPMTVYQTRRGARNYGQAIGILQLDCSLPFIPGDVDNASTYRYPVLYRVVPGLSTAACLR